MSETWNVCFRGTAKVYRTRIGSSPEHSYNISVGTRNSQPCFRLEGQGLGTTLVVNLQRNRVKKIESRRLNDGKLTIVFQEPSKFDMISISGVGEIMALQHCVRFLEQLTRTPTLSAPLNASRYAPLSLEQTPPSHSQLNGGKPFFSASKSKEHSYGGKMLAASSAQKPSTAPAGFYKSSSERWTVPPASPLLPDRVSPFSKSPVRRPAPPRLAPPQGDARQALVVSSAPSARKRLPLSDLSEPHSNRHTDHVHFVSDDTKREGFANLGNTCYMNAVLQSLMGLDPFAEDLLNHHLVTFVSSSSLFKLLFLLLKSKRAKDSFESQRILLRNIKSVISSRATKFHGYSEQDAHELLSQCLDQLKEETAAAVGVSLCPVTRSFKCELEHTITCKRCGKSTERKEEIYDFALQLPKSVLHMPNQQATLKDLFDLYFTAEEVEYTCSGCKEQSAMLSHQISKLPRILILYLKRYGFSAAQSMNAKRTDFVRIPRFINVGHLCADAVESPCDYSGPWPSDPAALSTMVGGIAVQGKENCPNGSAETAHHDDEPLTNHASQPNGPDTRSSSAPPHCDQHSEPTRVTDMSRTNGWTGTHDVSEGGREPGNIVLQDTLNTAPKGGVGQLLVNGKSKESDADRNKEVTLCDGLSWSEGALADRPPLLGKRSRGEESPALAALLTTPTQEVDSNCKMRKVEEHADVVLEVDKPSSDSADLVTAPSEQDCIDRAVQESLQESLQEQHDDFRVLHEMGLSEEQQLTMALELSIQDTVPENPGLFPSEETAEPEHMPSVAKHETYRLMSIVSHIGKGTGSGHYICDVNCVREGVWKSFNDSHVCELKEEDVRQRRQTSGYIFFYMNKTTYDSLIRAQQR